jgi:ABC-type multidrug transport system ATPase subunit
MKACPHCSTANADGSRFCQRCGRSFDPAVPAVPLSPAKAGARGANASPGAPADATVLWTGQALPGGAVRRAVAVEALFAAKNLLTIGRSPDCDVCLPHPTISRHHALLERLPEGLRLHDLGSVNGVFVEGRRLTESVWVREGQHVGIGPFLFSLAGGEIYTLDNSRRLRLEARHMEKVVPLGGGKVRRLLDDINLAVEPGEFVSLLGPSGSGKSTLMDCLNGRRRATGGRVLANGEDFYRHFDSFRQSLGYVPQRDIVHAQLTVARALHYTARLRLPSDTGPAELAARTEEVLELMELGPHRHTLVAHLSGGQIKRVSLGAELLARPCLLYIDEATSGLDAGTEARMMRLFRQLADEGKSVVCITHNVDNVDRCQLVLVLAQGKLVYYGPPREALPYFGVHRLGEIYDRLAEREPEAWERQFAASPLHQEFVEKRLAAAVAEPTARGAEHAAEGAGTTGNGGRPVLRSTAPRPYRPPVWHQFRVLTARYGELMWGDRRSLRLLLLQAPVVALFILLGFVHKPYQEEILAPRKLEEGERKALHSVEGLLRALRVERPLPPEQHAVLQQVQLPVREGEVPVTAADVLQGLRKFDQDQVLQKVLTAEGPVMPDRVLINPRYTYMLLYIVVLAVMWFGCNNAAKEIVKEEAVYGRERAVNLGILPYLASKFLVLGILSAVQVLLLMLVIYGALELFHAALGHEVPPPDYRLAYGPQYGVLVLLALTGVALGLLLSACVASPDRANALLPYVLIPQIILGGGIISVEREPLSSLARGLSPVYWAFRGVHLGETDLPKDFPFAAAYDDSLWLVCAALAAQAALLLLLAAWALRRKDVRKA